MCRWYLTKSDVPMLALLFANSQYSSRFIVVEALADLAESQLDEVCMVRENTSDYEKNDTQEYGNLSM